jgi:importin subunit alpha-1
VLPCLHSLLSNDRKGIRKETCWALSNITAGSKEQIQAVIEHGIIPVLVHMLEMEDFDIRKECAWAISNATSGGDDLHIKFLVDNGCVLPLVNLLDKPDVRIVSVALEGIENILKCGQRNLNADGTNPLV